MCRYPVTFTLAATVCLSIGLFGVRQINLVSYIVGSEPQVELLEQVGQKQHEYCRKDIIVMVSPLRVLQRLKFSPVMYMFIHRACRRR